jgi:hypothetical protein
MVDGEGLTIEGLDYIITFFSKKELYAKNSQI